MIEQTIAKIEERLRAAQSLSPAQRAELHELLSQLRRDAGSLPPNALSEVDPDDDDLQNSISRLAQALTSFETSHPQLTGAVNRISAILANMGI